MKKSLIILIILITCSLAAYSQTLNSKGTQINVKGKITDIFSGSPVSVSLEFKNSAGRKVKIKAGKDGHYQQILNAEETYEVTITNFDILKKIETITLDNSTQYAEKVVNFEVKKLTPGTQLYELNAFEPNKATVNKAIDEAIDELNDLLIFNRSVKLEILISANDSQIQKNTTQSTKSTKTSKSKKSKKAVDTESVPETNTNSNPLIDKRIAALQTYWTDINKYPGRIKFTPDYSSTKQKSGKNLIILISSVENAME